MLTKTLTKQATVAFIAASFLAPTISLAAERGVMGERASSTRASMGAYDCTNIDNLRSNITKKLGERAGQASSKREEFAAKKEERMSELESKRDEADSSIEERFASLEEKADTDEKKAAVEEFISTVKTLISERRDAVDAAIEEFEAGVEELKASRDNDVDDLEGDVEDYINGVYDDAKSACLYDDASFDEIRTIIKDGMESLRSQFQSRRDDSSAKDELEALKATRKAAFEAAAATFKEGMEEAKTKLKAAFGA